MGVVSEYLKLIPTIIENRGKILESIVNEVKKELGTLPEGEQEEIIRRRAICAGCPFMSENAKKESGYITDRIDKHCIMCGCSVKGKTSCITCNCGIETFNNNHPDAKLELKWTVYEQTSR